MIPVLLLLLKCNEMVVGVLGNNRRGVLASLAITVLPITVLPILVVAKKIARAHGHGKDDALTVPFTAVQPGTEPYAPINAEIPSCKKVGKASESAICLNQCLKLI